MKKLNRNYHICVNATGQNLSWCVNKQQEGLRSSFDHTMQDQNLDDIDIEYTLKNWIDYQNMGDTEEIRVINPKKINDSGFYEDKKDGTLWLTIGDVEELEKELLQEIDYQKEQQEQMEEDEN